MTESMEKATETHKKKKARNEGLELLRLLPSDSVPETSSRRIYVWSCDGKDFLIVFVKILF